MLGLLEDAAYQTSEVKLSPQDVVMLFTDGLYEVEDRNNALYSQPMLVAGVQQRAPLPVPQLFDDLLSEIRRFSANNAFADDVCLVAWSSLAAHHRKKRRHGKILFTTTDSRLSLSQSRPLRRDREWN